MELPDGIRIGHWSDFEGYTGCTVVLAPQGTVAAGEVRGGGPGTRESDLLSPAANAPGVQAVCFAGGSAYGLAAADGKNLEVFSPTIGRQLLELGLIDEIDLHIVPVLLGGGVRLFDHLGTDRVDLEKIRVVDAPGVTHLHYRVVR